MDLTDLLKQLHKEIKKESEKNTKDKGITSFAMDPQKTPKAELGQIHSAPPSTISTG